MILRFYNYAYSDKYKGNNVKFYTQLIVNTEKQFYMINHDFMESCLKRDFNKGTILNDKDFRSCLNHYSAIGYKQPYNNFTFSAYSA